MLAVHLLIIALILWWIRFLWSRRRFYMLMLQLPGKMGLPLLGIALEHLIKKRGMTFRSEFMDKHGSTVLSWLGPVPLLVTRDPTIIKDVLVSSECINKSSHTVSAMNNCIGFGLLALRGNFIKTDRINIEPIWSVRRKLMNPAFKTNVLLFFFPILNDETKKLVTLLDTFIGQGETDVLRDILRWSFRVSIKTTLGSDVHDDENFKNNKLMESYQSIASIVTLNTVMPFLQNNLIAKVCGIEKRRLKDADLINTTLKNIIDKRLKCNSENTSLHIPNTVINRAIKLYRDGDISYEDVASECSIMISAAFETSGLTVWHTLILLAMFPNYQDLAYEELKRVFPTREDFEVTDEDMQQLTYLDRVVNESLRLLPAIPFLPRETSEDFRLSNGILVPRGVTIGIDIFSTHRNPDVWGSGAGTFNPDNFLTENILERHPYAFIPFSKGKRNCIGWKFALMTAKLGLAKILRNFEVGTTFRYEDLEFVDNFVMELAQSPKLEFKRRG